MAQRRTPEPEPDRGMEPRRISQPGGRSQAYINNQDWGGSRKGLYDIQDPPFTGTFTQLAYETRSNSPFDFGLSAGPATPSYMAESARISLSIFRPLTSADIRIKASISGGDETEFPLVWRTGGATGPIQGEYELGERVTFSYSLDTTSERQFFLGPPRTLFYHFATANGSMTQRDQIAPVYSPSLSMYLQIEQQNGDPVTQDVSFGRLLASAAEVQLRTDGPIP